MQDFLTTQRVDIDATMFLINLLLTAVLCFVLGLLYVRFGHALSNRRMFARNFVLIGMTTMLIITVVKSSLALSLGLVGALSIVRFRAAIKEPEELAYLFLVISVGLGFGADQRLVTLLAFTLICVVIWATSRSGRSREGQDLHLTVTHRNPKRADLSSIVSVLSSHCPEISLRRVDESDGALEASFVVSCAGLAQLQAATADLRALDESVAVSFLDQKALLS